MGSFFSKRIDKDYTNDVEIDGKTIYYKSLPNFIIDKTSSLDKQIDIMEKHVEKLINDKIFYDFLDKDHKYILNSLLKNIKDIKATSINKKKMVTIMDKINGIQEYIQHNKINNNDIEECDETTSLLMK